MGHRLSASVMQMDVRALLESAAECPDVSNNCMFQLCMMLARASLEDGDEAYKQTAAQRLIAVLRDKPTHNVVHLFAKPTAANDPEPI